MKHPTADNVWLVFIQLLNSWSSLRFVAGVGLNVLLCNPSWGLLCVCRFYLTNCWVKSSTSHFLSSVSSLSTWSGVSERPSCSTNQRWQPARSRAATNGVHNEKRAVFGSSDRTASCQPADGNRETEGPHTNKPFGLRLDSAALKQIWGAPAERKETWRTCGERRFMNLWRMKREIILTRSLIENTGVDLTEAQTQVFHWMTSCREVRPQVGRQEVCTSRRSHSEPQNLSPETRIQCRQSLRYVQTWSRIFNKTSSRLCVHVFWTDI